jgi:hypothetical protein
MPEKVKTESIPLFNHKFEAIRPFGPTVIRGTVPMDLIHLLDKKATKMLGSKQLSKEFNHAQNLAGNVQKEVRFPSSWMSTKEFKPMVEYMGEMVKAYISIPPANETISPAFVGKLVIQSMWMVSQWAGDFNPFHIHEGQLSGVIYLRIPPGLKHEDIINRGGKDAINVVIHEMLHVGYYQYHLKDKEEETLVNSMGNFLTEILGRSELKAWLIDNMKK